MNQYYANPSMISFTNIDGIIELTDQMDRKRLKHTKMCQNARNVDLLVKSGKICENGLQAD